MFHVSRICLAVACGALLLAMHAALAGPADSDRTSASGPPVVSEAAGEIAALEALLDSVRGEQCDVTVDGAPWVPAHDSQAADFRAFLDTLAGPAGCAPSASTDPGPVGDRIAADQATRAVEAVEAAMFETVLPSDAALGAPADDATASPAPVVSDAQDVAADDANAGATPPPPGKRDAQPAEETPALDQMKQILTGVVVETPEDGKAPAEGAAEEAPASAEPVFVGNPLDQVINIDFREMELTNVVALLAQKAQVNVIAGPELKGVVTANLKNVSLRRAMDTVLRMNGLGIVEEEGIYRIVPYEESIAAKRTTTTVRLENVRAGDARKTLEDVVKGSLDDTLISFSTNESTNLLIIAGPETRVLELAALAESLDIAKPVMPTITEAIKINNSSPKDLEPLVKNMLSDTVGKVAIDERSRTVVVTDEPIVVEKIKTVIEELDIAVKQVSIESMIIDAVLSDDAQTGVDWIVNAVKNTNTRGEPIGSLQSAGMETDATGFNITPGAVNAIPMTGRIAFGVLTGNLDIQGAIAAQVESSNARLLANPVVVTVENKKASIKISQEIPYIDYKQSTTGPAMSTTSFKDVGIVLEVTPAVSHDGHVIAQVKAKQSDTKGELNGIPIEDKREAETTLRTKNGQTMFIGGLRRFDDETTVKKVPVLGDIPVMNIMFRNNVVKKESTELLVFLTCNVLPDEIGELPPALKAKSEELDGIPMVPNSQSQLFRSIVKPGEMRDPAWRWRRAD